jgi:hypothetical protein
MNNAKIPLGVAVCLLCFGERPSLPRLLIGGGIILAAVLLNEASVRRRTRLPDDMS